MLIENAISRPFCSEKCIVSFHSKIVDHFESFENNLRKTAALYEVDDYSDIFENNQLVQSLLSEPDEVWLDVSELGEHYYFLLKKIFHEGKSLFLIGISLFYYKKPSMLLFHTVTQYEEFVNFFKNGKKVDFAIEEHIKNEAKPEMIETEPSEETPTINPEVIQALEKKKSEYLADFLTSRSEDDIAIEKFHLYEKYTNQVLNDPDEIFQMVDNDQDQIMTYVKSFVEKGKPFFYIVVCVKIDEDDQSNQDVLIPIITFPSTDSDLYHRYKLGEKISGGLRN
jgi:hypothetical protein